jgi:hypothetical protein
MELYFLLITSSFVTSDLACQTATANPGLGGAAPVGAAEAGVSVNVCDAKGSLVGAVDFSAVISSDFVSRPIGVLSFACKWELENE